MKKSILKLTVATFFMGAIITSCSTSAEKVENAEAAVTDANADLAEANEAYIADVEKYRTITSEKIAANDQSIKEFKARIEDQKSEARAEYNKKIEALEKKNNDMKKQMDDYQATSKEKWESFKTEFSNDMDELGNALKDFFVTDKK